MAQRRHRLLLNPFSVFVQVDAPPTQSNCVDEDEMRESCPRRNCGGSINRCSYRQPRLVISSSAAQVHWVGVAPTRTNTLNGLDRSRCLLCADSKGVSPCVLARAIPLLSQRLESRLRSVWDLSPGWSASCAKNLSVMFRPWASPSSTSHSRKESKNAPAYRPRAEWRGPRVTAASRLGAVRPRSQ